MSQPDFHVPDDLSGLDEPPQMASIGHIDPAVIAHMDQMLVKLQHVMGQLISLTLTAQGMDPHDPESHRGIQFCASQSSDLVDELNSIEKNVLINMLVVALVDENAHQLVEEVRAYCATNEGGAQEPPSTGQPA